MKCIIYYAFWFYSIGRETRIAEIAAGGNLVWGV